MTFVGCDLHTRTQQVAVLDTCTGEVSECQLAHDGTAVEEFYAVLPRPVTIGIESTGDGYLGWPEQAPFDAIMVTAAPDHVPQPLVDQLAVGGRMIIPVGVAYQEILLVSRTPTGIVQQRTIPVRFVPLVRPPR